MTNPTTDVTGLTRREILQRGAWVSGAGALAWAAPAITTFSAAAATGSPPPDDTPRGPFGFSYIALTILIGSVKYALKFERTSGGATPLQVTFSGSGSLPSCTQLSDGTTAGQGGDQRQFGGLPSFIGQSGVPSPPVSFSADGGDLVVTLLDSVGAKISGFALKEGQSCGITGATGVIAPGGRSFTAYGIVGTATDADEVQQLETTEDQTARRTEESDPDAERSGEKTAEQLGEEAPALGESEPDKRSVEPSNDVVDDNGDSAPTGSVPSDGPVD